ncbi:hypothetical protein DFH09DRAFT_952317 [Mycena vulgaris]|nr:hypothetical protein DFH09DRAFT_952317 [Mycena vulgaris]
MLLWRELEQAFLNLLLRLDGLGDDIDNPCCVVCGAGYSIGGTVRLFRCDECGQFLQCQNCLLARHQQTPLHTLKEWNGQFWTEASLLTLGLIYQLGHGGFRCERPAFPLRTLVVIHTNGIHTVHYHYCGCDKLSRMNNLGQLMANTWYPATTIDPDTCATFAALEIFRLLSVVGNLNVHDYVGSLERLTDPFRISSVPDRYKAFGRMARQYAYEKRAKRLGRGHDPAGLKATKMGQMAVLCWPCPHEGLNLPEGWRDVDPQYRFLYMLILALDANFRLNNCLRANEQQDDSLGPGFSYFQEPDGYRTHLKNYVAESDVSTCIVFAALLQKETRMMTGLRCSGVGGCVCARHGVVRPLGLGDLQKGERYANMDYVFLASLLGVLLLWIAISYDIACQWKIHLLKRAKKIADTTSINVDLTQFDLQFRLPVWHAAAHEITCQTQNSLSYAMGVGRMDGEGIERTWAVLNPLGFSTKEMGKGARVDAIEDKVDHLNFEKNIGQGDTLERKLIVAIAERDRQVAAFKDVDRSLASSLKKKWQAQIDAWLADKLQPNLYCLAGAGPSEAQVHLELKNDEAAEAAAGQAPVQGPSETVSAFITARLQLEDAQHRTKVEIKGQTLVTADQASQIQERHVAFWKKLRKFEKLCATYMPGVARIIEEAEEARDPERLPPKAEDINLWMPSSLTAGQRRSACRKGVMEVEAKYRASQCTDALDTLRSRLHTQRHLITWRNSNSVGQKAVTRSATLIGRVGDRIAMLAQKYRTARAALVALKGEDYRPQFRVLENADITAANEEDESDAKARRKLNKLGSRKHRARNEPSAKPKALSWIWTVNGGPSDEDEAQLHECTCCLGLRVAS